jgi:hypothetical protein
MHPVPLAIIWVLSVTCGENVAREAGRLDRARRLCRHWVARAGRRGCLAPANLLELLAPHFELLLLAVPSSCCYNLFTNQLVLKKI